MNAIVLDANVAVDWFCPSAPGEVYSLPLEDLQYEGKVCFLTPLHFDVEIARILRKRYFSDKKVFPRAWLNNSLEVLDLMQIQSVALGTNLRMLGELSLTYNLDVPDVPYLHLARQLELPLATRDRGLITACKSWNVLHWTPQVLNG